MRRIETVVGVTVDVSGVGDGALNDLEIVQGASLIQTNQGPIIGLFCQYAFTGKGRSIHSSIQMESWGIEVDETSRKARVPGRQCLVTVDGHKVKITICNGLPYIDMIYPSDEDLANFPHVYFTADSTWDPRALDDENDDDDDFESSNYRRMYLDPNVNDFGELNVLADPNPFHGELTGDLDRDIDLLLYEVHQSECSVHHVDCHTSLFTIKQEAHYPKLDLLRKNFGYVSVDRIKKTLHTTTQFAQAVGRIPFRMHYKTHFPAANVACLNDDVAMDTFFTDVPAHDDGIWGHGGATMAQIFCGRRTQLTKAYPMQRESQMPDTLQSFINDAGAPNLLISDNSKVQILGKVDTILRYFQIKDHQSEPEHQHQNYVERRIQEIKRFMNTIMD
jgi:hypothetical protein